MKTTLIRPISAFLLLAAFVASPLLHSQENPLNLPVTEGEVTKLEIRQGVPEVLPPALPPPTVQPTVEPENNWIWVLDRRRSVEFPVDRTGLIRIETQITHTYPNAVDTSMVDADGVLIDAKPNTDNPSYQFPPAKYRAPYFIRVHNPYGHPTIMIPITSGRSGHSDGTSFQRETPSDSMESSSEYDESGDSDEGEYGEESMYGGCGGCRSCDLSHSKEIDDITTDHPNGVDEPGEGDGAGIGNIPAGHSAGGDSKTNINFEMDFGSGVNRGDFKLHSIGDAIVTRNSSQQLSSIMTDSSYTAIEDIAGGKIRIRHSSDPANPSSTVFREITFENSATNEIKKTSVLYPGTANSKTYVTIWRRNPSLQTWECVIANGLRKKKITRETNTPDLKVERHQIFERAAGATGEAAVLVSDVRKTFVKNQHGWKKTKLEVLDESGGNPLVTAWTYYDSTISDYAAGLLKSVTYPNGQVKQHQYSQPGAQHRHEIVSWFAGGSSQTTETRNIALGATTTEITKKNTASGEVFAKTTKEWSSDSQVEEKTYSSASGITSTSLSNVMAFGSDFGGKITNAVSTSNLGDAIISTGMTQQLSRSSGVKTITQASGQMNGSNVVIDGQSMQKIVNADGVVLRSVTTVIQPGSANGAVSSDNLYSDFDDLGRARRVDYFPSGPGDIGVYHELRTYACCGAASSTDRYGVVSYIDYDDLGRVIRTNRLGVTRATVYDALTVHSHRYPGTVAGATWTGAPEDTNQIGKNTTNLQGTSSEQFYRSSQTGALVPNQTLRYFRNPAGTSTLPSGTPADVGMRTVQKVIPVADDGATEPEQTTDYFLDGNVKETKGDLSPHRLTQYERNSTGLKVTQSYVEGTELYDDDEDRLKESVTTQYDYAGRTLTVQQGPGTTTYHYTQDKLTRVTDPDGVDVFYLYNARGEQDTTVLDLNGNNAVDLSTDQVTRTISQPMMVVPPAGGSPIAVNGSISQVIESGTTYVTAGESYSTFDGLLSWSLSPGTTALSVQQTTLSGSGNWTQTSTAPDDTQQVQTYTAGKLTTSSTLLTDHSTILTSTSYAYDSLNRTVETTDSRTGTSITEYYTDTVDAVKSVTDAAIHKTEFTYDHRGRRTKVNQPDTGTIANETITKYEPNGKTKEVTGDQTYRSTYSYDYAYRMKTLTTFGTTPATTTWNYDEIRGWLLNKRDAAGKGYDYQYTAAGRLHVAEASRLLAGSTTTRLKKTHTYVAGRLTQIAYNDGTTPTVTITYDRLSRPDVQSNGLASSDYDYDPATFALDKETITYNILGQSEFTRIIDHKQDTLQRNEGYQLKNGSTTEQNVTYGYSATNGRLGSVSDSTNTFSYGYTANSNLIGSIQGPAHTVSNTYEANRNVLLTKANTRASDSDITISSIGYSVNPIGQRTNATRSGAATNSTAWTYDALGQLVTANDSTDTFDRAYQYDGIGNRVSSSAGVSPASSTAYTPNALNQYSSLITDNSITHNPSYDDGNQIDAQFKPTDSSSLITGTYHWDAENRLIEVKNTSTTTLVKHYYDAQYRRIASSAGGVTTLYVYQSWNVIAEYTGSTPTLIKTNLWGMDLSGSLQGAGGVGGLLSITDHGSPITTHFPLYDGNGNITEYINISEEVVAHYEYDPFGNTTVASEDKADDFSYRFSTKPIDAATGLYYYGYRWYDAVTGRWINRDPIQERGGFNLYRFVTNDAVNFLDYLGLVDINLNPDGCHSNLLSPKNNDLWDGFSDKVQNDESQLTITGHGSPNSIRDDRPGQNNKQLTGYEGAEEMAKLIKNHPDYQSGKIKSIVFYSCSLGAGTNSFAQKISMLFPGIPVKAASNIIWCERDGKYTICGISRGYPNYNDPGEWRWFQDGYVLRNEGNEWKKVPESFVPKPSPSPSSTTSETLPKGISHIGYKSGIPVFQRDGKKVTWNELTEDERAALPKNYHPK